MAKIARLSQSHNFLAQVGFDPVRSEERQMLKKTALAVFGLAIILTIITPAPAHAGVVVGVGVGIGPVYARPAYAYPYAYPYAYGPGAYVGYYAYPRPYVYSPAYVYRARPYGYYHGPYLHPGRVAYRGYVGHPGFRGRR